MYNKIVLLRTEINLFNNEKIYINIKIDIS